VVWRAFGAIEPQANHGAAEPLGAALIASRASGWKRRQRETSLRAGRDELCFGLFAPSQGSLIRSTSEVVLALLLKQGRKN
jgi:hypothetical protein